MGAVFGIFLVPNDFIIGSQPGFRCTQGCGEEVSGVAPNIEFTTLYVFLLLRVAQIGILAR
jgi:hypothetical protein